MRYYNALHDFKNELDKHSEILENSKLSPDKIISSLTNLSYLQYLLISDYVDYMKNQTVDYDLVDEYTDLLEEFENSLSFNLEALPINRKLDEGQEMVKDGEKVNFISLRTKKLLNVNR